MGNIFDKLKKVFSSNIVLHNVDGKLKVLDTSDVQSMGITNIQNSFGGYSGLYSAAKSVNRSIYGYDDTGMMMVQRTMMFKDYEMMDMDPLTSTALNIVSDEVTTKDEYGDVLTIRCDDDKVKDILKNLFYDVINIDSNIWSWTRNLLKYGDLFLKLEISEKYGIMNIVPLSVYDIRRLENYNDVDPLGVKFVFNSYTGKNPIEFDYYEVAHFRLLSDVNYLPYGKSFIESSRRVYKQLSLLEDAMMIHRIMRAPERRIFKIDIGSINNSDIDAYMNRVVNKMKKVPLMDPNTGDYNLKYNMQSIVEDFYIPVRGQDSGGGIDTLSGLQYNAIDDIEYLRDKQLAALQCPKAFLGYGESVSGKGTMAAMDVRFAKTVERVQKAVIEELYKMAIVHLYVKNCTAEEMNSFTLTLTNPSVISESEKIELWTSKTTLAGDMKDKGLFSSNFIYKTIFNLTENEIAEIQNDIIEDKKVAFRYAQIENEGNDPAITKKTFGTAHDIASIQQGGGNPLLSKDKNVDDIGLNHGDDNFMFNYAKDNDVEQDDLDRKYEHDDTKLKPKPIMITHKKNPNTRSHYGQDSHIRGRDPLGKNDFMTANKLMKNGRSYADPVILDSLSKIKVIRECTLYDNPISDIDVDTFLNENNIIDDGV